MDGEEAIQCECQSIISIKVDNSKVILKEIKTHTIVNIPAHLTDLTI